MTRLERIAKYTKGFKRVCDIGCDHGYTLLRAFRDYHIDKAYAIDINECPLEMAKNNLKGYNVSYYLSDGLTNLEIDFEVAIISGMGGRLIKKIISDSLGKFKNKYIILEPQGNIDILRNYLNQNNFKILKEEAFYDQNKYYEILFVGYGNENLNMLDLQFGPYLRLERNEAYLKNYRKILDIKKRALLKAKTNTDLTLDILKLEYALGDRVMNKIFYDEYNYYEELFLDDKKRDLVITFPGGGYSHTSNREATNVGLRFNELGYHSVVFYYREKLDLYPDIYIKIAKVIQEFRKKVNVKRIFLNGFSAGGHLALELGLHSDLYEIGQIEGLILCYPVVSSDENISHKGSFTNLLGANYDKYLKRVSEDLEVNSNSPKMFIWHTVEDQAVSVFNSFRLVEACLKNKISVTYHLYPIGRHGIGFADKSTALDDTYIVPICQSWWNLLKDWLELYDED